MHVLLTNDDGPLNDKVCPYFKYLVDEILVNTDWKLTIVIPDQQRSWIGKAHFAGKTLGIKYLYTKITTSVKNNKINSFIGPFEKPQLKYKNDPEYQEWHLINSTPAACSDIGIHHLNDSKPIDLVISGPNFGKNSSNLYILTSGTVGAAMEAVTHGVKSIAVSFAFNNLDHDYDILKKASEISLKLIKKLYPILKRSEDVDLFSINVPLVESLLNNNTKIHYAPILQNSWGSIYTKDFGYDGDIQFSWTPDFKKVYKDGLKDHSHTDSRVLLNEEISVTPLKAQFQFIEPLIGEIDLDEEDSDKTFLIDIPKDQYIYEPLVKSFKTLGYNITSDKSVIQDSNIKVFHYCEYEDIDIDSITNEKYFIPSYIYRKALIRKNYLANTIHHYIVKNPKSILNKAIPETYQLEVDYAEFLDDSLDEAYELRDEIEKGDRVWILKPSMSDKGQGIRIFKTIEQLQNIFNSFEEGEDIDTDADTENINEDDEDNGIIISQLRHFIVQEYKSKPLLLSEFNNRKFHLRVYIICQGDLNVFVYKNILALFSKKSYKEPIDENEIIPMDGHLTNTCLQENETQIIVKPFWNLNINRKNYIFDQICDITSDLFKAASTVDKINFQPLQNAIEFYGVDFLVNNDLSVNLLEVNAYPDFKQTGDDLKDLINILFCETVENIIDPMMNNEEPKQSDNLKKVL
ncbi:unnamed protein product [Candida verbasci]|uniref:Survival protein SurE-like phosphatase/nucleotidase domain-containing protein n=1 Tax=Candida verbasci TaxID=1227364 RepID=A0A9W4TZV7_9ASCO|nr:unnamed protein product [Candida verbasci]